MNTEHAIDWLQFSTTKYEPIDDIVGKLTNVKPFSGYTSALQDELGTIILTNERHPGMKKLIVLSGQTLHNHRLAGFSDKKILHYALFSDASKVSRIDLAVTIDFGKAQKEFTPHIIHHYALNGLMDSKLALDNPVDDTKQTIETCYIGSRKARNRIVRIYDKGLKLGGIAEQIIRIEMQTNKGANKIAIDAASGKNYAGLIRRYVDFPNVPIWNQVMDCEPIPNWHSAPWYISESEKLKEENSRRWNWLLSSVAPALAKAMVIDESLTGTSEPNIEKFLRSVEFHKFKLDKNRIDPE